MPIPSEKNQSIFIIAILVEGGLIIIACLLNWWLDLSLTEYLKFDPTAIIYGILTSLPLLMMFGILVKFPVGPFKRIDKILDAQILPLFNDLTVFQIFIISVAAGIGEETFFRGVVQIGLTAYIPLAIAIAISSIIFGMLHCITITYAIIATIIGIYFSVIVILSQSLIPVIIAHALYDFLALYYLLNVRKVY